MSHCMQLHGFALALGLALVFCLCLRMGGDPRKPPQAEKDAAKDTEAASFTLKVPVDVVVVNATVTDKNGRPVRDLTAQDFKVFEDGKQQPIHTFGVETYQKSRVVAANPVPPALNAPSPSKGPTPASSEAGASDDASWPPRNLVLFLDDLVMYQPEFFPPILSAMRRFVENELGAADQVSMMTASGLAQSPFTSDKKQLRANLDEIEKNFNRRRRYLSICPQLTDYQAKTIVNDFDDGMSMPVALEEFGRCFSGTLLARNPEAAEVMVKNEARNQHFDLIYRSRQLLSALRMTASSLKHLEGKKNLFLCSNGFVAEDMRYEMQKVIDNALRAGVIINTLKVEGLVTGVIAADKSLPHEKDSDPAEGAIATAMASAPAGPVSTGTTSGIENTRENAQALHGNNYMGSKKMLESTSRLVLEGALQQLAADTGGMLIHDTNDLFGGLKKLSERESFNYVLSYASPTQKDDGGYHKIKIEVLHPGLTLSYRKGYYSPQEQQTYQRRSREDILEVLNAPGRVREIPVELTYSSAQLSELRCQLNLVAHMRLHKVKFIEESNRFKNLLDVVVVAFDENDHYVDGLQKTIEFNLSPTSYDQIRQHELIARLELQVPPGRYTIKSVVREASHTLMGSAINLIEVP
jgi:VWFA-related protein